MSWFVPEEVAGACLNHAAAPALIRGLLTLAHMLLELRAVAILGLARIIFRPVGVALGLLLLRLTHLLIFLLQFELLLLCKFCPRILIQIVVERLLPVEGLVGLGDARRRLMVALDLRNLHQVLMKVLTGGWSATPSLCFIDDGLDCPVLDHRLHIYRVVHVSEDATGVHIRHLEVVEQLEPEGL